MKPEILWVGNSERAPWRCLRPGAGAQKAGGPPSVMASSSWAWGLGWDGWGQAARKCIALHVLALWVTKHHFHQFYSSRSSQKSAAAAKSLQSSPTLCDPINGSPPGCPVPGILQARTLEWIAISFSNALKWKVKIESEVAQLRPHGLLIFKGHKPRPLMKGDQMICGSHFKASNFSLPLPKGTIKAPSRTVIGSAHSFPAARLILSILRMLVPSWLSPGVSP